MAVAIDKVRVLLRLERLSHALYALADSRPDVGQQPHIVARRESINNKIKNLRQEIYSHEQPSQ